MATIERRTTKDGHPAYRVKVRCRGFPPQKTDESMPYGGGKLSLGIVYSPI